jgi:hypothetical protein
MAIIERSHVIAEAAHVPIYQKAGAVGANDFAGECVVGSLAVDTSTPDLYQCTATDGATTSTWEKVGLQT